MSVLDAPEVIKRERDARRKKLLFIGMSSLIYIFILAIFVALAMASRPSGVLKEFLDEYRGWGVYFEGLIAIVAGGSMLFAIIALLYFLGPTNLLREMVPLPDIKTTEFPMSNRLRTAIDEVAIATGKEPLDCLVMESSMPNAMAVRIKRRPCLVVTTGLLRSDLTGSEMTAIVAHEAAHIATGEALSWRSTSRTLLFTTEAAIITTLITWALLSFIARAKPSSSSYIFLLFILAASPLAFTSQVMKKVAKQDDLFADSLAVMITRDPDALHSAISKIAASPGDMDFYVFRTFPAASGRSSWKPLKQASISRRFFVNPAHRLSQDLPKQDVPWASYMAPSVSGYYRSYDYQGAIRRAAWEEENFIQSRLAALESIERGSRRGHRAPASQWE